jgi:hypothetical protein
MKLKLKDGAAVDPDSGLLFKTKRRKNLFLIFLKDLKILVMYLKISILVEYLQLFLVLLI